MKTVEDHPVKSEHIATGLNILQKRQNKLSMMSVLTGSVFIVSFVAIFIQQDFIYSFFGLTQTVEQLHIPYSIQGIVSEYHNQPDLKDNRPWTFWQKTNQGKISGINKNVDLNVFHGDEKQWQQFLQRNHLH